MLLRYFLIEYHSKPWEWDVDYPEDMYGKFFSEDINALVQIDYLVAERRKEQSK